MRTTIYNLMRAIGSTADLPEPIYEFGAYRALGQDERGDVRGCFPGKEYVGTDARAGPGVDRILDLHRLELVDASVGTAILLDTVEHVERPWQALEEIARVLKPGGVVVMASVMFFPIHLYPDDYWRFTASGFRALLKPFDDAILASVGIKTLPHTVLGIGMKAPVPAPLRAKLAGAVDDWQASGAQSWKEVALNWVPPVFLAPAYEWFASWQARNAKDNDRQGG
jgi:SAM-dependent methyltransferase